MTPAMTIGEIKELLDLFNASGVGELEIEREGVRIRIRKAGQVPEYAVSPGPAQNIPPQEPAVPLEPATSAKEPDSSQVLV
jgi:biotin carboxyl carrier protein